MQPQTRSRTCGDIKVQAGGHGSGHRVQAAAQQRRRLAPRLAAVLQPGQAGAGRGWEALSQGQACRSSLHQEPSSTIPGDAISA